MFTVESLKVNYGGVKAVQGVSLEVRAGEITALLGANGAGKSSTLHALVGAVRPAGGKITLDGQDVTNLPPNVMLSRGVALIPEGGRVFARQTVERNLRLGAYIAPDQKTYEERLTKVFQLFPRLAERRAQVAGTLSGGERQMLAIGRALMGGPRLLLIDEPSLGLSPLLVETVMDALKMLAQEGVTILLVEQNVGEALEIAQRAYVMQTGSIVLSGSAEELSRSDEVRRAYLGL